jgi:hypothetical protein
MGTSYVELTAGQYHSVARRSDGSLVQWGTYLHGQFNIPVLPAGTTYVEVTSGVQHNVARRSDGAIVAWGRNFEGQCNVPPPPAGLSPLNVMAGMSFSAVEYGFPAAVASVGTGCGGVGTPLFVCTPPSIGASVTFNLYQGTPLASGFLYFSLVPAAPIALGSGCTVELDLSTAAVFTPVAASAYYGSWSANFPVPFVPAAVGTQFALQIVLLGTAGPLGFDLSNGLIATIGY